MFKAIRIAAPMLSAVALLAIAAPAWGDTFRVTRTQDPTPGDCKANDCSLREAVLAANNDSPGPDRIVLPNQKRAYKLTIPNADPNINEDGSLEGDLDITNGPLKIVHNGKGLATIAASNDDRAIEAFENLTLTKLLITGGDGAAFGVDGGAVETRADAGLVITHCKLIKNKGDDGGALEIDGKLKLVDSLLMRNTALDDAGAIRFNGAAADSSIRSTRFVNNKSGEDGGALDVGLPSGTLVIDRSTFSGNQVHNDGGGAINLNGPNTLTIKNSTFSGNAADGSGGAVFAEDGTLNVVNSTFSGNLSNESGGAIAGVAGSGTVSVISITAARNVADADNNASGVGGGLFSDISSFGVTNSLIALNDERGAGGDDDCSGTFTSFGGNLLTDENGCSGFDTTQTGDDLLAGNPKIGQLAANGGPTKTIALKQGSPAIGHAKKPLSPKRDQRGRKRDAHPDSGAFERGA